MQVKGAVAVVLTAFTIGGSGLRAEQASGAPAPVVSRPLRFTLAPGASAPVSPLVQMQIASRTEPRIVLEKTLDILARSEWNCGMPVMQPPPDVDPAFERKPDPNAAIPIRQVTPRGCGR